MDRGTSLFLSVLMVLVCLCAALTAAVAEAAESEPPAPPTTFFATPSIYVWSSAGSVAAGWSGASDGDGSGIHGYGVSWSSAAPESPPVTVTTGLGPRLTIAAGGAHTVAVLEDGTAVAVGSNADDQCEVGDWKDVVAVAAGGAHTVGLLRDGSVIAVGLVDDGQCEVGDWSDIVAVAAGDGHTVGVQTDGSVVAAGDNSSCQCDVGDWSEVVAVAAGAEFTVGLRADGTVVATGTNDMGQCDVEDWTGVAAVAAGREHTVGLLADGAVVAVGNKEDDRLEVGDWKDVVAVAAGGAHTVGLLKDGSAVAVGDDSVTQCDVKEWTGLAAITAGDRHTVGLLGDGTALAVGTNDEGRCDVKDWKSLLQPALDSCLAHTDGLTDGSWYLNVRAVDREGNWGATASEGPFLIDSGVLTAPGSFVSTPPICEWTDSPDVLAFWTLACSGAPVAGHSYSWSLDSPQTPDTTIDSAVDRMGLLAAGVLHTVGVCDDGTVVGCGYDDSGQVTGVAGWSDVVAVAAGRQHTVGLHADGTVVACGTTYYGLQSDVADWVDVLAVTAGEYHTVGLRADGTVLACGDDSAGQVSGVAAWSSVAAVAADEQHTVAVRADGTVVACGDDSAGQVSGVTTWSDVTAVAAGRGHTVGLRADGTVVACGNDGAAEVSGVSGWSTIVAVAAGFYDTVGLRADGTVLACGWDLHGGVSGVTGWSHIRQPLNDTRWRSSSGLADGRWYLNVRAQDAASNWSPTGSAGPFLIDTTPPASLSDFHTTPTSNTWVESRDVLAFWNSGGDSGSPVGGYSYWWSEGAPQTPDATIDSTLDRVGPIAGGRYHTVGLRADGTLLACGSDDEDQVSGISHWSDVLGVSAGAWHTVGLHADGTVVACGHDSSGSVDDVDDWSDVVAIAAGGYHTVGLRADGTVVAHGDGSVDDVDDWSDVVAIAAGGYHTVGLRSDGTVLACGSDDEGQVSGISDWSDVVAVAAGEFHTVGLRTDGRVVACGRDLAGEVAIAEDWTDVVAIAAGDYHTVGLHADGTVDACGQDSDGSVSEVGGWTDVVAITAGSYHTVSLRDDGTVMACGWNSHGQVAGVGDWSHIRQPLADTRWASTSGLADGRWYLNVRAQDAAGNWGPSSAAGPFLIDTTTPATGSSLSPSPGAPGWHTAPVTVTLDAADDGSAVTTRYRIGGSGAFLVYSAASKPRITAQGTTTVQYYSTDALGHQETLRSLSVKLDSVAPSTTATRFGAGWSNEAQTVTFKASDMPSGLARVEYRVDGGSWRTGTTCVVSAPKGGGNDGVHSVDYRSVDVAGNVEAAKSVTVRIDTRGPTTKAVTKVRVKRKKRATLRYKVADRAPNGGTATVVIRVKNAKRKTVKTIRIKAARRVGKTYSYRFRCTLKRGTYRYYVYATDAAGNRQARVGSNKLIVR